VTLVGASVILLIMRRSSLSPLLVTLAISAAFAGPAQASTAVTGDPWIDQYIEQVPTVTGDAVKNKGNGSSGLSDAQISELEARGGQRFAAATAATVPPVARKATDAAAAEVPSVPAALAGSLGGSGGLGPVLPAALLAALVGAIALAFSRFRRNS
jgi:hypothetical protein